MASAFPYPAGAMVFVPLTLGAGPLAGAGSAPWVESTVKASPAAMVKATIMRRIEPQICECGMPYCSASPRRRIPALHLGADFQPTLGGELTPLCVTTAR